MKSFIYKLILIIISIIVVYKLTIGDQINSFVAKTELLSTKEGRKITIDKIRNEIKRASTKENFLSKEDALLIKNFINKIKAELDKAEDQ